MERTLWLLLTGALQLTPDEQLALTYHLYSCLHCQLTLRYQLREVATQEADDPRLYGSALTLLDQLSHITSRSVAYSQFLAYSRLVTSKGKEAAAASFPAIVSHIRTCPTCIDAFKEVCRQADPVRLPARSSQPGRKPQVTTPQATFVADWMKAKRLRVTRAQMARYAHISPAFITRYFNSKDPTTFRVDPSVHEAVCECLHFDDAPRREYLAIWGIAAEATAVAAVVVPSSSYHSADVERYEEYVDQLEALVVERIMEQLDPLMRALEEGEMPESIISALEEIYRSLRELPGDVRVAEAQLRVGLFLALLQEMALPTQFAMRVALATYDDLLHHVFPMLTSPRYADDYFQVLMRRIVLRRLGRAGPGAYASESDLGLPEQADAIRRLLPHVQDPSVIASYYCQRLHTHAVAGNDEAWMDELRAVERLVKGLGTSGARGDELDAILQYTQGAGMRHLAWLRRGAWSAEQVWMAQLSGKARSPLEDTPAEQNPVYDATLYRVGLPRAFARADIRQVVSMLDAHLWHDLLDELKTDTGTQSRDPMEPTDDPESA